MTGRWGLSNSSECLASLSGKRVVGFISDALPLRGGVDAVGNKTLIFEDGTGFTFNQRGAFWHESAEDVARALDRLRQKLEDTGSALRALLSDAGVES